MRGNYVSAKFLGETTRKISEELKYILETLIAKVQVRRLMPLGKKAAGERHGM